MAGVAVHVCTETDEMGVPLKPEVVICGNCGRAWCEREDPTAVSWGCHYCHGRGYTTVPVPPRQARALGAYV